MNNKGYDGIKQEDKRGARKSQDSKSSVFAFFVVLIYVVIVVLLLHYCEGSGNASIAQSDTKSIAIAKTILEKGLKAPSSVNYYDSDVVGKDSYGRRLVYLEFTVKNSFGGAERCYYYVCFRYESEKPDGYYYNSYIPYVSCSEFSEEEAEKLYHFGEKP